MGVALPLSRVYEIAARPVLPLVPPIETLPPAAGAVELVLPVSLVAYFSSIAAMTQHYIAFLRGINLGKKRLPMSRLKSLFEELGFSDVETFIASGNVLFATEVGEEAQLESRIAKHLETSLGYDVVTFVRTVQEVSAIAARKMFPEEGESGVTIHVGFLHHKLTPEIARKLTEIRTEMDEFRVKDREYYWLCRGRTSDSKVWSLPEIKALRLPSSTMRNISSIRKLVAKHCG